MDGWRTVKTRPICRHRDRIYFRLIGAMTLHTCILRTSGLDGPPPYSEPAISWYCREHRWPKRQASLGSITLVPTSWPSPNGREPLPPRRFESNARYIQNIREASCLRHC
jgi:hypothetical protein